MNYRLKIIGHTCPIDKERHNQGLSEKRAEAVKQWLVDHGYPSSDIQVKGMEERKPVSDSRTDGKNRRAEIRITSCIRLTVQAATIIKKIKTLSGISHRSLCLALNIQISGSRAEPYTSMQ